MSDPKDVAVLVEALTERERAIFDAGMRAGAAQVHREVAEANQRAALERYKETAVALERLPQRAQGFVDKVRSLLPK